MTYKDIIERLEKARGPDRTLDAHILCAIHGLTIHEDSDPSTGIFAFWENGICHNCTQWDAVTSTIDEAFELADSVLPEANCYGAEKDPSGWIAYVSRNHAASDHWLYEATAPTGALAILLALFKALDAKERRE